MAKFKVGDKVRLKKGLEVGTIYEGVLLSQSMKESAEADGGIHEVKKVREATRLSFTAYILDTDVPYYYAEEMLELAEEKEDKTEKTKKEFNDFLEALVLMSQLNRIVNRLDEIMKSNEEG